MRSLCADVRLSVPGERGHSSEEGTWSDKEKNEELLCGKL